MFLLFTFSFGTDFYIAAGVLLGIEIIGLFMKVIDFSPLYKYFVEEDLVDDTDVEAQVKEATEHLNAGKTKITKPRASANMGKGKKS